MQTERLLVASRLAADPAGAHTVEEVAGAAVRLLHGSFDYYLAVVQRLDGDGSLRVDEHTAIGARMLERIPFRAPVAPLVRSAHERFDGGGYPDRLAGEQIPRGAMIIATCDAFHAMTSNRTYRRRSASPRRSASSKPTPAPGSTQRSSRRWSPSSTDCVQLARL